MFYNCKELTTSPVLKAATLKNYCYQSMFNGCSKLSYIKALFTTTPTNTFSQYWTSGVASTGTFVKKTGVKWTTRGSNAVPNNWTIEFADS